jgi:hypothetical protein
MAHAKQGALIRMQVSSKKRPQRHHRRRLGKTIRLAIPTASHMRRHPMRPQGKTKDCMLD